MLKFQMVDGGQFAALNRITRTPARFRVLVYALAKNGRAFGVQLVELLGFQDGKLEFFVSGDGLIRFALVCYAPAVNLVKCGKNEEVGKGRPC